MTASFADIVTDRDIALRGLARRLAADAAVSTVMSSDVVCLPEHVSGVTTLDDLFLHEHPRTV